MQYEDSDSEQSMDENEIYKKQLLESFKQTGIMDNLKATLRKQLVDKLQDKEESKLQRKEQQEKMHENQRFFYERKLVAFMIADFMKQHKANYTYSVFLPEMRLESDYVLSKAEILEALQVSPKDYTNLVETNMDRELSALEILMEVIRQTKKVKKREVHCQTETDYEKSYQQKMDDVSKETKEKMDKINVTSAKNYEEQIRRLRADLERRYQESLEEEIQRVRDFELAEIRAQETESFQQKLRKHKYDMDKIYEDKLVRLKERERTALELCKRRQQDLDKIAMEQRQQHIKEIDNLRDQEAQIRRHNCLENEDIKKEQEKIKKLEAQLKMKIREYDQAKLSIQTRIEQDISQRKKLMKKEQDIEREGLNLQTRNEDTEMIRQHRENLSMLESQRQYLQRDLDVVRRDNKELEYIKKEQQKEIQSLRANLDQFREEINAYQERLHQSEAKTQQFQKQVDMLSENLKQNQEFNSVKQDQQEQLHKTYSEDVQKYQNKSIELEKYYYNKMQQMQEKHRFEILGFKNQAMRMEDKVQKLQDEGEGLRLQLRDIKREDNIQKNKEIIDDKYNQHKKIQDEIDDLGSQEFQARINKTQGEMKEMKEQYLKDLDYFQQGSFQQQQQQ